MKNHNTRSEELPIPKVQSTKMASEKPVSIVVIGMAGSGKTTFMQRINSYLHQHRDPPYVINLDPAVYKVPFESNIDIRDSVNYKEVMKQYNLGPNGGILTSLNLFATKVDQIVGILEKRTTQPEAGSSSKQPQKPIKHILVDTPGQIEVFVWSASGDILLGSLASTFPTVIAYIIDTPRSASTSTFMSNMLYACSILYKTKLPMILVFNKTDVKDADFAKEWMTDFEAFQAALRQEEESGSFGGAEGAGGSSFAGSGSGYMSSLLHSMSLVLDEFYKHLKVVAVSSVTGHGVPQFFEAVREKKEEFERDYKPELERRKKQRDDMKEKLKTRDLNRMMDDMKMEGGSRRKRNPEPETISDLEDAEEDEDEDSEDEDREDGLSTRYQQALNEKNKGPTNEDMSFIKYLHTSNMG
jgi:GTPase SAR1 family protein